MGPINHLEPLNRKVKGRSWRDSVEWSRKAVHLLGCPLAFWVLIFDEPIATGGLFLLGVFIVLIDFSRLKSKNWAVIIHKKFAFLFRKDEHKTLTGSSAMIVGAALTSLFFEAGPAFAGIMCLALGDSAAAIVGQAWSFRKQQLGIEEPDSDTEHVVEIRKSKTFAGSFACFIVSGLIVYLFITTDYRIILTVAGAATAMERWTPGRWDNITIPLVTAAILQFLLSWQV